MEWNGMEWNGIGASFLSLKCKAIQPSVFIL